MAGLESRLLPSADALPPAAYTPGPSLDAPKLARFPLRRGEGDSPFSTRGYAAPRAPGVKSEVSKETRPGP